MLWKIIKSFLAKKFKTVIKEYKMTRIMIEWRQRNSHNFTRPGNPVWQELFPIDNVTVGNFTYGVLHVVPYKSDSGRLFIGSFCSIAREVKFLLGGNHRYTRLSTYPLKSICKKASNISQSKGDIVISDDVWIGENVIVLSGCKIGQGAVIAANSVVVKDIEPYSINGGNPCKFIKYRFSQPIIKKLLTIDFGRINLLMVEQYLTQLETDLTEDKVDDLLKVMPLVGNKIIN